MNRLWARIRNTRRRTWGIIAAVKVFLIASLFSLELLVELGAAPASSPPGNRCPLQGHLPGLCDDQPGTARGQYLDLPAGL